VEIVEALSIPKEGTAPTKFNSVYAQPFLVQFNVLMKRCMVEYWRNPGYNAVRVVFSIVLGVLLGSIYYRAGATINTAGDILSEMRQLLTTNHKHQPTSLLPPPP
jgi:hypothetical protein